MENRRKWIVFGTWVSQVAEVGRYKRDVVRGKILIEHRIKRGTDINAYMDINSKRCL